MSVRLATSLVFRYDLNNSCVLRIPSRKFNYGRYRIGWICLSEVEQITMVKMWDEEHIPLIQPLYDYNVYTFGSVNGHNVAIAGLP